MDNSAPGEPWSVSRGLREVSAAGHTDRLPMLADTMIRALDPVDPEWLGDRLSLMWLAMGHSKSSEVATAWLSENTRLLLDLPADILADALDQAIKESDRGFMPPVGAIRKIADPMFDKRRRAAARLRAMVRWQPPVEVLPEAVEAWTLDKVRALPMFAARSLLKAGAIAADLFEEAFPPGNQEQVHAAVEAAGSAASKGR